MSSKPMDRLRRGRQMSPRRRWKLSVRYPSLTCMALTAASIVLALWWTLSGIPWSSGSQLQLHTSSSSPPPPPAPFHSSPAQLSPLPQSTTTIDIDSDMLVDTDRLPVEARSEDPSVALPSLQRIYQRHRAHPPQTGSQDDVDNQAWNSELHQCMDRLRILLATKSAQKVLEVMGEPDEVTENLNEPFQAPPLMPGPVIMPGADPTHTQAISPTYLLYYWRGRHDYLWFKVLGEMNGVAAVVESGWHHDYE